MLSTLTLADFAAQFIIQSWLVHRGMPTWEGDYQREGDWVEISRLEKGWQVVAFSGFFLVASLIITITQFA